MGSKLMVIIFVYDSSHAIIPYKSVNLVYSKN